MVLLPSSLLLDVLNRCSHYDNRIYITTSTKEFTVRIVDDEIISAESDHDIAFKDHVKWFRNFDKDYAEIETVVELEQKVTKILELFPEYSSYLTDFGLNQTMHTLVEMYLLPRDHHVMNEMYGNPSDVVYGTFPVRLIPEIIGETIVELRFPYMSEAFLDPDNYKLKLVSEKYEPMTPEEYVIVECARRNATFENLWNLSCGFSVVEMDEALNYLIESKVVEVETLTDDIPDEIDSLVDVNTVFSEIVEEFDFKKKEKERANLLMIENHALQLVVSQLDSKIFKLVQDYQTTTHKFDELRFDLMLEKELDSTFDPSESVPESYESLDMLIQSNEATALLSEISQLEANRDEKNKLRRDILLEMMSITPCDGKSEILTKCQKAIEREVQTIDRTENFVYVRPMDDSMFENLYQGFDEEAILNSFVLPSLEELDEVIDLNTFVLPPLDKLEPFNLPFEWEITQMEKDLTTLERSSRELHPSYGFDVPEDLFLEQNDSTTEIAEESLVVSELSPTDIPDSAPKRPRKGRNNRLFYGVGAISLLGLVVAGIVRMSGE